MIEPIIQKNPYKPDCGDILSGGEYLIRQLRDTEFVGNWISTRIYDENPWRSLKKMGINTKPLEKAFKYTCPFTGNTYYLFVPLMILLNSGEPEDIKVYRQPPLNTSSLDYAYDLEYNKEICPFFSSMGMGRILDSMLGHGYTDGTLPSDGDGEVIKVLVGLDNGDFLAGFCWQWYNK